MHWLNHDLRKGKLHLVYGGSITITSLMVADRERARKMLLPRAQEQQNLRGSQTGGQFLRPLGSLQLKMPLANTPSVIPSLVNCGLRYSWPLKQSLAPCASYELYFKKNGPNSSSGA